MSPEVNRPGLAANALPGLARTGLPVSQPGLSLAASAAYGFTEAIEPAGGGRHTLGGTLAAAFAPAPFVAFALRLDGRADFHPDDGHGAHTTAAGDPRAIVRLGRRLSPELALGLELGAWFPGEDAPSFKLEATTPQARVLASWQLGATSLLGALGYRLDNSAKAAPERRSLRPGDRAALGLSDFDALLAAAGVAQALDRDSEVFLELSADLLVGSNAPPLTRSPLRVTLGGRRHFSNTLSGEVSATVALSQRPALDDSTALLPIEPRILVVTGLRFGPPRRPPDDTLVMPDEAAPVPHSESQSPPSVQATPPAPVAVEGQLLDDAGEPLTEAQVTLRASDGETREAITDAEGRYHFPGVPPGVAELRAEATGFETLTFTLEIGAEPLHAPARSLSKRAPGGVLRGLTRSFDSEPLQAQVRVRDRRGRQVAVATADAEGRFELSLPPGRYRVSIELAGYRSQSQHVKIDDNEVTILNVDLRSP